MYAMKSIVLAEKPSVGKEIGRILRCDKKTKGFWEGREHIVTWALGHLVELADPGEYDERYKTWQLDYLPMLPERMRHRVIRKTSHQFKTIRGLFTRNDVNHLIIATDAGREGELVARWTMRLGGWKGPVSRLWISSQTDTAVLNGFSNLKPGQEYENLFRAAECRAEADWIIGMNVTRALTCKHDARLSAGRVQTPTLDLIVKREQEIDDFIPAPYFTIQAEFGQFKAAWTGPKGANRISDPARAGSIAEKVSGKEAVVTRMTRKQKNEPPPRYTEGNLLHAMENAGKLIEDQALRKAVTGMGLGTVATRADIIEKLLGKYYIERHGAQLRPTTRGIELLDLVPDQLKSAELTGQWEQRLTRIAAGQESGVAFCAAIRTSCKELVLRVKNSTQTFRPKNTNTKPCPMCGKKMLAVRDKRGRKLLTCQSFACGYEEREDAGDTFAHRPSRRERAMNQKLIRQYSDNSKETATLGDLIKASRERNQKN